MVRTFNVQHAAYATVADELQRELAMLANVTLYQEANDTAGDSYDLVQRPRSRHTLAVSLSAELKKYISNHLENRGQSLHGICFEVGSRRRLVS